MIELDMENKKTYEDLDEDEKAIVDMMRKSKDWSCFYKSYNSFYGCIRRRELWYLVDIAFPNRIKTTGYGSSKELLFQMAKNGDKKPKNSTKIGRTLYALCKIDEDFKNNIYEIRPDWKAAYFNFEEHLSFIDNWLKNNNKFPSRISSNKDEVRVAHFLKLLRKETRNGIKKSVDIFNLLKEKYPIAFDLKKRRSECAKKSGFIKGQMSYRKRKVKNSNGDVFDSISEAEEFVGYMRGKGKISKAIKNKTKAKGLFWEYVEEDEENITKENL